MNCNGINNAITSISSPGVYFGDPAFAPQLASVAVRSPRNWCAVILGVWGRLQPFRCRT
ncbi:MAG: hypothetical protein ACTSP1_14785 [Candidatus Freyarchaeota archaeon]